MGDPVIKSLNRIVLVGAGSMNIITTSGIGCMICVQNL